MMQSVFRILTRPAILALLGSIVFSGCYHVPNSCWEPQLAQVPTCQKQSVHVILVDSFVDIFHIGKLPEIAERLQGTGFCNARRFSCYRSGGGKNLAKQIRCIKELDPNARVMLVGWSAGSTIVVSALNRLQQDGICVESVVYLDSSFLKFAIHHGHPRNVGRSLLIYRHCNRAPDGVPNAQVICVNENRHLAIPTRCNVYDTLLAEVHRVSQQPALVQYQPTIADPWLNASAGCESCPSPAFIGH